MRNRKTANSILKRLLHQDYFSALVMLLVMCICMTIVTDKFATRDNILSWIRSFSYIAIMAYGMCMVIITGGIDLSVGSVAGMSGILVATAMTKWSLSIGVSIGLTLVFATLVGVFNAFLIINCKLQPFIATMGTLNIFRGLCYTVTQGFPVLSLPKPFLFIGQGYIFQIPTPIWIMLFLAIIAAVFLNITVTGRRIFAVGGNAEATRISGVNIRVIKSLVYIISGFCAGVAGVIMSSRIGIGQPSTGQGYETDVIASVVIGGASMNGGKGTIIGSIIGAATMALLRNALVLLGVDAYYQQVIIGTVIIVAVIMDVLRSNQGSKKIVQLGVSQKNKL